MKCTVQVVNTTSPKPPLKQQPIDRAWANPKLMRQTKTRHEPRVAVINLVKTNVWYDNSSRARALSALSTLLHAQLHDHLAPGHSCSERRRVGDDEPRTVKAAVPRFMKV